MARRKDTPATEQVAGSTPAPTTTVYPAPYLMPPPYTVRLDDLTPDPANARTHNERNLSAIMASLKAFGQRTPIVAQRNERGALIVRKGNGTVEAARRLGWEVLSVVVFDEGDAQAVAYAIADNRTAELAEWDELTLVQLLEATRNNDDPTLFEATGFSSAHLDALMEGLAQEFDEPNLDDEEGLGDDDKLEARIIITCPLDVVDEVRAALNTLSIPGVTVK